MKASRYAALRTQIDALIEGEEDLISVMATVACELYQAFDEWNWVGFYRLVDPSTLKVGPYQGTHGCLTIAIDRGVCGKCVREAANQLENDVTILPHHIACSPDTRAELVVPVLDCAGSVRAVLDIDSRKKGIFDQLDVEHLESIARAVGERYPFT